jgi:putative tryptophan/tyrosine transport system substrate-binding protein
MRSMIVRVHRVHECAGSRDAAPARGFCPAGLLLLALGVLVAALPGAAQPRSTIPLVGVLAPDTPAVLAHPTSDLSVFRQALRELGYIEGQTIALAYRFAEDKLERLPALAAELVGLQVDLIVAYAFQAARAAQQATPTLPIVMVRVGRDPVEAGLVASLARPGGNLTGLTMLGVQLHGKRLELLKEVMPRGSRVAALFDGGAPGQRPLHLHEAEPAARALGFTMQAWEVHGPEGFEQVFTALTAERPDALYVAGSPLMVANRQRIATFALQSRLPSVYEWREAVEDGGLMSYGTSNADLSRRAAAYVDKILKGAKPADLPVEQPRTFELVINLKTAKALDLTIPPVLLFQAAEVIQ